MENRRFTRLTNAFLKETGKPESIGRASLRALQFRAGSSHAENDTSDGGSRNGPSLDGY
jgi:hypothetical protein